MTVDFLSVAWIGQVTWVSAKDVGRFGAHVMANPAPHAGQAYPLVTDAASHAEFAESLSKMAGESYGVKQLPIKEWYDFVLQHGSIEVSPLCPAATLSWPPLSTDSERFVLSCDALMQPT